MIINKWNYEFNKYDDYEVPDDWDISVYKDDLHAEINCAQCGEKLEFGDSYTSRVLHNGFGMRFGVCQKCHKKELQEEKKIRNQYPPRMMDAMSVFPDERSYHRYCELYSDLEKGEIEDLKVNPKITLRDCYTDPQGNPVEEIRYEADFSYRRRYHDERYGGYNWKEVVEMRRPSNQDRLLKVKKDFMKYRSIDVTFI